MEKRASFQCFKHQSPDSHVPESAQRLSPTAIPQTDFLERCGRFGGENS